MCMPNTGGLLSSSSGFRREYTYYEKLSVWLKAEFISGGPEGGRYVDHFGNKIVWEHYGRTDVATGWEIDHIIPISENGPDVLNNWQPLQWEANRKKGGAMPSVFSMFAEWNA